MYLYICEPSKLCYWLLVACLYRGRDKKGNDSNNTAPIFVLVAVGVVITVATESGAIAIADIIIIDGSLWCEG